MNNYTLYLIKSNGNKHNITPITSNLSWKDSIETLGMELNCNVVRNKDDKYMTKHDLLGIGDKLVLSNNGKEVFRGIIVTLDTERYNKSITALDFAFYLNQSKVVKQFRKIKASEGIKQLCSQVGVPVGKIDDIPVLITKIYKDNTVSDIIKDMLEQALNQKSLKYRLEMRLGKLYVEKYSNLVVKGEFKLGTNVPKHDIVNTIGSVSKSESITDMRNSIIITSGNEKSVRVVVSAKDSKNISNFGLLQEVEEVDKKDIAKAKNIAKNKLKELNRIGEDISIELLGDDKVRAGRTLVINNDMFGLKGQYLVKDCTHTYQNSIHKMSLNVGKVK